MDELQTAAPPRLIAPPPTNLAGFWEGLKEDIDELKESTEKAIEKAEKLYDGLKKRVKFDKAAAAKMEKTLEA